MSAVEYRRTEAGAAPVRGAGARDPVGPGTDAAVRVAVGGHHRHHARVAGREGDAAPLGARGAARRYGSRHYGHGKAGAAPSGRLRKLVAVPTPRLSHDGYRSGSHYLRDGYRNPARRTHEIAERVALGANRRGVLTAIFRRPLTQVGLGIAAGAALIAVGAQALSRTTQFEGAMSGLSAGQVALLVAYAAFMLGVCLLACVVPTRRALQVEPIVAMRVGQPSRRLRHIGATSRGEARCTSSTARTVIASGRADPSRAQPVRSWSVPGPDRPLRSRGALDETRRSPGP